MCSFFFSSRRRHTRLQGDWSSDVCSSDLGSQGRGDGVAELLFSDEDVQAKQSRDPVAPALRSEDALRKAHSRVLDDGTPVHSFQTLIAELTTIVRNTCRRKGGGEADPIFSVATTPNAKQQRALDLVAAIRV